MGHVAPKCDLNRDWYEGTGCTSAYAGGVWGDSARGNRVEALSGVPAISPPGRRCRRAVGEGVVYRPSEGAARREGDAAQPSGRPRVYGDLRDLLHRSR